MHTESSLRTNHTVSIAVQKLHLDIQMGEHPIDPNTEKTKDNMEALENSLKYLIDQMTYITRQQAYQRVNKYVTVLLANITSP